MLLVKIRFHDIARKFSGSAEKPNTTAKQEMHWQLSGSSKQPNKQYLNNHLPIGLNTILPVWTYMFLYLMVP